MTIPRSLTALSPSPDPPECELRSETVVLHVVAVDAHHDETLSALIPPGRSQECGFLDVSAEILQRLVEFSQEDGCDLRGEIASQEVHSSWLPPSCSTCPAPPNQHLSTPWRTTARIGWGLEKVVGL